MLWHLRPALIAALILNSAISSAQEMLEEIEVSSAKANLISPYTSSSIVTHEELTLEAPGTLTSSLENIPGLVTTQNGGLGSRSSFFIRGTESRHISFTLDNLKLNDPSNTDRHFDTAFFTSDLIHSLEVFRGPQGVLFGSDALGGVINLTSRKGDSAPETRLRLRAGSFDTSGASVSSDWRRGDHQGSLTTSHLKSEGISRLNKKRFGAREPDKTEILQISSSSRHSLSKSISTDLLIMYLRGFNELDGAVEDNSVDKSLNKQYVIQQTTSYALKSNQNLSLRNGINQHERALHTAFNGDETYRGKLMENEVLHEWSAGDTSLVSGLATEHEDLSSQGIKRSFDLHSLFSLVSWEKEELSVQIGGRLERHTRYGEFETASAGISKKFGNQKASLNFSKGFKAPSLFQLYDPQYGNKKLVPEENHAWEASFSDKRKSFENEITFFQNRLSHLIVFSSLGYLNQGDFISEGTEWIGEWKSQMWKLSPSFTHQRFKGSDTKVLRRPVNLGKFTLSWLPDEKWEFQLIGKWIGARWDVDENNNNVKLNPYETLDLNAKYRREKSEYSISITNLLNREYEDIYGFSVMPLSLMGMYLYRF